MVLVDTVRQHSALRDMQLRAQQRASDLAQQDLRQALLYSDEALQKALDKNDEIAAELHHLRMAQEEDKRQAALAIRSTEHKQRVAEQRYEVMQSTIGCRMNDFMASIQSTKKGRSNKKPELTVLQVACPRRTSTPYSCS